MERLYRTKLVEFDFPIRTLNFLERGGIITIGDLVSRSFSSLLEIPPIGVVIASHLGRFLHRYGLKFECGR